MITYFTPNDLKNYLTMEFYHSLDLQSLHQPKITSKPKRRTEDNFVPKALFSLLKEFYSFLAILRYSVNASTTALNIRYKETNYNQFVKNRYKEFIKKVNNFIILLFNPKDPKDKKLRFKADLLEDIGIHIFYDLMQTNLKEVLDNPNRSAYDASSLIEDRFVNEILTFVEKNDSECHKRVLKNKQKRYLDRALYWEKTAKKYDHLLFYFDIENSVRQFMTQRDRLIDPKIETLNNNTVTFLLLLSCKYHIVLHQYAHEAYEFRNLNQHFERINEGMVKIERAQKIFTFIRLVAKYFPFIFVPDNEKESKAIAKTVEILCYIRRGLAYSSLGHNVFAFNDYTAAEKQANLLRDTQKKNREDYIRLYSDLTIPYIYYLKGELYRKDDAFYNAHQYFCNSVSRFEHDKRHQKNLDASLKIVRIKIVKGKTFLELGEFRKSLKWYLKALEQLLKILKPNKSTAFFDDMWKYLEETRLDPKLVKSHLYYKLRTIEERMRRFVRKINTMKSKRLLPDYRILLSDLFNRISMVIFLLNLPDYGRLTKVMNNYNRATNSKTREKIMKSLCRNVLACEWLSLAFQLNPRNYLARFNSRLFELESISSEARSVCNKLMKKWQLSRDKTDLMDFGNPRDIIYRYIAKVTLESLSQKRLGRNRDKKIAKSLLQRLLLSTDDFSTKNAELYKYLMKKPHENIQNANSDIYFYVLKRWSSINPALPRPSAFKMKGGGYFFIFNGKGIAIDPGFNFIENLYSEGFSIGDIDYVIATHDHIDHTVGIDTILSLHYRRCMIEGRKKCVTLLLNPSVSSRYGFIVNQDPKLFQKIELTRENKKREIFEDFSIEAIRTEHLDISSPKYSNSIGLVLVFSPSKENEFKIGITGDTRYNKSLMKDFLDVDIFIVHINGAPFEELTRGFFNFDVLSEKNIEKILNEMNQGGLKSTADEIRHSLRCDPNDEHLHLKGVLETYKKFKETHRNSDRKRLFLISEISEEMGSHRHKVATLINEQFSGASGNIRCLTGDIGMAIRVKTRSEKRRNIEIRCSRCNLNNDYTDDDKFHDARNIKEVCLKQDDEGIFYYCQRHDPENISRELGMYGFAERVERYQPFKHIDIRIT